MTAAFWSFPNGVWWHCLSGSPLEFPLFSPKHGVLRETSSCLSSLEEYKQYPLPCASHSEACAHSSGWGSTLRICIPWMVFVKDTQLQHHCLLHCLNCLLDKTMGHKLTCVFTSHACMNTGELILDISSGGQKELLINAHAAGPVGWTPDRHIL